MDKLLMTEAKSTEEVQQMIESVNSKVASEGVEEGVFQIKGKLIVGSLDFKAFYPSMDIDACAEIAKQMVTDSDIKVEVDTEALALFTACSNTQEQVNVEGWTKLFTKESIELVQGLE